MKKCPRCGYENSDNAAFCEKCYYPLPLTPLKLTKCPRCGYENPEGVMFCEKCHYPLFQIPVSDIQQPTKEEEKSKIILKSSDYTMLLIGSVITSFAIALFFLFYPDMKILYTVFNVIGTVFLIVPFIKVNKLYWSAVVGSVGIFFLSPNSLVGVLLFSFGGVIVSTALRELYLSVKDNIVQFSSLLLLLGYLFGMFILNFYMVTISGYALLAIYSVQKTFKKDSNPG